MYEVIAEPQEQSEQAQQEIRENLAQGPVEPSTEQQPEGKPRCILHNLNYEILYIYYLCITFQELFGTLVA